jgi:uncharacterized membrane protein YdjX (TVP38/TMEM64 family)
MKRKKSGGALKWIALGVVIVGLFVAARLLPVGGWLNEFNEWVGHLGWIGVLLFIAVYALATVLFVPGSVLTIGAGFTFGLFTGSLAVSAGSIIGASFAFWIARVVVREKIESLISGNEKFHAIDRAIAEQGWKLVFMLRLSPLVPFNLSNYFYALTGVKFWPYVFASWVGMMPGTVLYVYLGTLGRAGLQAASGGAHARTPAEWAMLGVGFAATVAVTAMVTRIARNALKKSELAAESKPD